MDQRKKGKLLRDVPMSLLDVSLSGCRMATNHPIDAGTCGVLQVRIDGKVYHDTVDIVRMTRHQGFSHTFTLAGTIAFGNLPGTASLRGEVPSSALKPS